MSNGTRPDRPDDLQRLCDDGQQLLMKTRYVEAEKVLAHAAQLAGESRDYDTLGRVYYPLQEARRQRRQRCGEGVVRLDLWPQNQDDRLDGRRVAQHYPHGQLLVAGWGTVTPAAELRRVADEHGLYVETFLGAAYPLDDTWSRAAIVVVPTASTVLPPATVVLEAGPIALEKALPAGCILLGDGDVPRGMRTGTPDTFARTMAIWERLHAAPLAAALEEPDPRLRIDKYAGVIGIDYACEKAHQWLAETAIDLARGESRGATGG